MSIFRTAIAIVGTSLLAANAAAATFTFDENFAQSVFANSTPLTDRYAEQGITFGGTGATRGGYILDQAGGFGFDALSGRNFLAFNAPITGNVENISFAGAFGSVSIWGASEYGGSFTMNAYNAGGTLIDSATAGFHTNWTQLSVSGSGIARVELIGNNDAYAYDDLQVSAVPEPSTWAMLLAGAGVLGWMARRRQA